MVLDSHHRTLVVVGGFATTGLEERLKCKHLKVGQYPGWTVLPPLEVRWMGLQPFSDGGILGRRRIVGTRKAKATLGAVA
jgi:hypothetical protein